MAKFFKYIFWIFINFLYFIKSGRIVGNIINHHKPNEIVVNNIQTFCMNENKFTNPQCIITNKNNLIYCEKDRELFLEDNNFIKGKKLISISPGGLKGFYELGILSFIKENYDMENYIFSGASAGSWCSLLMVMKKKYNLIECLAKDILEMICSQDLISFARVEIDKLKIYEDIYSCAVILEKKLD